MNHDHHRCDCPHERLRYCKKCSVPHCLDCGQEWVTRPYNYYYHYYTGPYSIPTTAGLAQTGSLGYSSGACLSGMGGGLTSTSGTALVTTCQHEGN
jgi:hypothetical protein